MKIQYASDLHIEFPQNNEFLLQHPLTPVGDVLVLAGDVVPFAILDKHQDFFNFLSDNFVTTYWIPGNHEYYYFDAIARSGTFKEKIRDNVFLVNNISVIQNDIKFIFSTLWTKISPKCEYQIENNMSDFHVIKYNEHRFSSRSYNHLHEENLAFIKQSLKETEEKKIVVFSHHVPTFLNYPEKYRGSFLNEGFAVELHDLIEFSRIDYWIYGHHHVNIPEFIIGETRLVTNQLGYVSHNEHQLFETNKCIEL